MMKNVLREGPLTRAQMLQMVDDNGFVTATTFFGLDELIDYEFEPLLDLMSERVAGSSLGMDINYEAVGFENRQIAIEVTMDVSMILDDGED